jgi:hypothetical protein
VTYDTDETNSNDEPVVLDIYGVKIPLRPGDLGDAHPKNWAEVVDRISRDLRRIAVAPIQLIAEVFETPTRLLRGISLLSRDRALKVKRAHARADFEEEKRQEEVTGYSSGARIETLTVETERIEETRAKLVGRLAYLLNGAQVGDRDGTVVLLPDGVILVAFGTPTESREAIESAAAEAARLLSSSSEKKVPSS